MALSNHERVGKALDLLKVGLAPFVERELKDVLGSEAAARVVQLMGEDRLLAKKALADWDVAGLLKLVWEAWNEVFRRTLGPADRSLVSEIRTHRNKWAHQEPFSTDDAYRALDSSSRLLASISAPESGELEKMKMELLRVRFDEQARGERRKNTGASVESPVAGTLKPWREVVTPHKDVASGKYQQAEFAADLWQVHLGEGSDEYRDPSEFFRRTFLTESLKQLLVGAVERLSAKGGDPVVQLQTNFGGGKTHSMLALYHLFSGAAPGELAGVDAVMAEAGVSKLPQAKRVVLVGNKISPGNPVKKSDGTIVRTLWGELAWQLGYAAGGTKEAKKALSRIAADDERATSPGDVLRELLVQYGPALILIDEWVAYARQLHDHGDLPGGTFETHFTFAQALSESAKLAKNCLLVVSLPASDTATSPHAVADDVEVGGERGRAALNRLRNAIGRVEASWRPASAEEGFEIVRRRLFQPLSGKESYVARDNVARAFAELYQCNVDEFPPDCREGGYEKRIKDAYPIHPEIFDRLYTDWSTLVKFQRTRGVLRLMAAVIHSLWERDDRSPLILPAHLPIADREVQFELTRYLPDNWIPVIEKDVDGPSALPLRLDGEVPNLGKYTACRRVARTIYLGSAPTANAANRGIEDRRVKLGCVMPGESPAIFGDALRRLATAATYLYPEGSRYWYSTQPTVTKLAEDRAEQLRRNPDAVAEELAVRLRKDLRNTGDFLRVHPMPQSGQDVADDTDARLVVLGPEQAYSKGADNPAEQAAKAILEARGNSPRLYRNTLVFLAVDQARLQDLDEAIRRYLAWQSILDEKETQDLSPHQVKQAEVQRNAADTTVNSRLPEAYQWLLVPVQKSPQDPVEWQATRLSSGHDALAVRVCKKLKADELLITSYGPSRIRMDLDRIPLWRGDSVAIKQLAEDYARYIYLSRLKSSAALVDPICEGLGLISWRTDSFAYAESYDPVTDRYRGLTTGRTRQIADVNDPGVLVKSEVAQRQIDAEKKPEPANTKTPTPGPTAAGGPTGPSGTSVPPFEPRTPLARKLRRYHGTVTLNPARVASSAGNVADEVIAHLTGLLGANVTVTLEIEAEVPAGVPENVVRTVTENSRTLKFTSHGFEEE